MTSTSDELWATSNPTGHGDLSLNRPEIETIEEAFSCEPWSHKDTSGMPINGSFIPKVAVERHVLTCHVHPFFSLYWCKFGSFSLASLSCRCFYVGLKVDRGQKGLKGCFFPQRWLENLNLQGSASKNSPSFSDDQHTFCMILFIFVKLVWCWGSVVPAQKSAPGVGPRLCNGCWDPVNLVAGLDWIGTKDAFFVFNMFYFWIISI